MLPINFRQKAAVRSDISLLVPSPTYLSIMMTMCWTFSVIFTVLLVDSSVAAADNAGILLAQVNCTNPEATEAHLERALFAEYSPRHRPRRNPQNVVNVTLSLALEAIKDIREKEHQITVAGYLYVNWIDDYLIWNNGSFDNNFSCINVLIVPAKSVWLPDIALMNAPRKYDLFEAPGERVRIYNDGFVHFRPGGLFSAVCEFDLTYFPFDEQVCTLRFQSWMYLHSYMAIILEKPPITIARWTENEEWRLIGMAGSVQNVFYSNPAHKYDSVIFQLNLRRKVGFYIMNVIIPSIIISFVELVTFALPSHEVIKIHISFTSLLAYTVFQLMIIPEMPQTSEHTPMLSIYIVLEMGFIGFALLGQGFVFLLLDRAERSAKKAPYKVLLAFAKVCAPFLMVSIPKEPTSEEMSTAEHSTFLPMSSNFDMDSDEVDKSAPAASKLPSYYGHNRYYRSVLPFGEVDDGENRNGIDVDGGKVHAGNHCTHCKLHCEDHDSGTGRSGSTMSYHHNMSHVPFQHHPFNIHDFKIAINNAKWMFIIRVIDRIVATIYVLFITITPFFMFFVIPIVKPRIGFEDSDSSSTAPHH